MRPKPPPGVQLNYAHPLSQGLVGCWLFNEGTGTRVRDLTQNALSGTLSNSPSWGGSIHGGGISLNGSNHYVEVGDTPLVDFADGNFTISAWFRTLLPTTGQRAAIVSKYVSTSGNPQFQLNVNPLNATAKLALTYYGSGDSPVKCSCPNLLITDTRWHHLLGLRRGATLELWLDGILVQLGPNEATATIPMQSTASKLRFGNREDSSFPDHLGGGLDDVRIYSRALSADEVRLLYSDPYANFDRIPFHLYWTDTSVIQVGVEASMICNTLAAVPKTGQATWNDLTITSKTGQSIWNVSTMAAKTSQSIWDVRTSVSNSRAASWNVSSLAAKAGQAIWNDRAIIGSSRQSIWNTNAVASVIRQSIWRVLAALSVTRQSIWNVRAVAFSSRASSWNISSALGINRQSIWSILAITAANTRQAIWSVRKIVTRDGVISWDTLSGAAVSIARPIIWNVRALAQASGVVSWNVTIPAGLNRTANWSVLTSAGSQRSATWNIRALASADGVNVWDVREAIPAEREVLWSVTITITVQEQSVIWMVREATGLSRDALWNILAKVSRQRQVIWRIESDLASPGGLPHYDIGQIDQGAGVEMDSDRATAGISGDRATVE